MQSIFTQLRIITMIDYLRAVWLFYLYGQKSKHATLIKENRKSIFFVSKAARFYTVGASGLLVNYVVSILLASDSLLSFFYLHATAIGIICSITSNFFLNKIWTFGDRNFSFSHTARQYCLYCTFGAIGAGVQLSVLYLLVNFYGFEYMMSLLYAVGIAAVGNFLLNKKWTFQERTWGLKKYYDRLNWKLIAIICVT